MKVRTLNRVQYQQTILLFNPLRGCECRVIHIPWFRKLHLGLFTFCHFVAINSLSATPTNTLFIFCLSQFKTKSDTDSLLNYSLISYLKIYFSSISKDLFSRRKFVEYHPVNRDLERKLACFSFYCANIFLSPYITYIKFSVKTNFLEILIGNINNIST